MICCSPWIKWNEMQRLLVPHSSWQRGEARHSHNNKIRSGLLHSDTVKAKKLRVYQIWTIFLIGKYRLVKRRFRVQIKLLCMSSKLKLLWVNCSYSLALPILWLCLGFISLAHPSAVTLSWLIARSAASPLLFDANTNSFIQYQIQCSTSTAIIITAVAIEWQLPLLQPRPRPGQLSTSLECI